MTGTDKIIHGIIFAWTLLSLFFLGACNRQDQRVNPGEHTEAPEEHTHLEGGLEAVRESLEEGQVLVTAKQMETVHIALGSISRMNLSGLVKAFGTIALPPSAEASVSPFIGGVVRNLSVIEGDYVKKGETIARIEHPDIVELQREYLEMRSRHEFLAEEYRRQESLYADSINAERTFQQIKWEYETGQAGMQSLRKQLELIHIDPYRIIPEGIQKSYPLPAPISGYVSSVTANTGVHISPQQELCRIAANEKAHIDLEVYERDIDKVKTGQRVTFSLANHSHPLPLEGSILKKSQRFDPETRTALVHARILRMDPALLPGMAVMAHIHTGEDRQYALPEEALVSDQGRDYVFRFAATGSTKHLHAHEDLRAEEAYYIFQRMEIDRGITEAGYTGIAFRGPVQDSVRFVISNAQALLAEMKKDIAGHSHAH